MNPWSPDRLDPLMGIALDEARQALLHGDVPVGCVVAGPEGVVARQHNRREVDRDPTAHAEILALREAASNLGRWQLSDCVLVVTLEPCLMCSGALVNARIGSLVYGAQDPKAGACLSHYCIPSDGRLNHNFPVFAGIRTQECEALLSQFFHALRKRP